MTNKPMLIVERELLELAAAKLSNLGQSHISNPIYEALNRHTEELRTLLDKPACSHKACKSLGEPHPFCDFALRLDAQHQGEPVAVCRLWNEGGSGERTSIEFIKEPCADGTLLCAEQPAPVAVVMPFAEKVISKLRRFDECVSDNQDVDIGRHWLDVLTQLGLLNRVQRSPAYWEMTQQGEDALEVARLNTPE